MSRIFNFSAGPAMLPAAVLKQAREELLDWQDSGMSVMEMSHRGKQYLSIAEQAEADLREIYAIPDNYKVLFLQGGASAQFSAIPMNLLQGRKQADYVNTGAWSKKAIAAAKKYCDVNVVASSEDSKFTTIPAYDTWSMNKDAAYLHVTPNETIGGVEFHDLPDTGEVPLIADMSSTILSRPIDISRYGLIYAGAQKNIGPAGLTLVIVREDLIGDADPALTDVLNYKIQSGADSMINTPPTYSWYLAGLVFKWIKNQGGMAAMGDINQRKANKLYSAIDRSDFYANPVDPEHRSWMNVPFTLADAELDATFLEGAAKIGLMTLKGHRSVGGMRASIYNAMPEEGVDTLVSYMQEFEQQHG
ncbi:MAG TPA: 3-phosphoserine/phosphohydroxythreonine transaminase [Gammaproteobacteria bacterium]|nr:3-phosphoserine/phosphohydroxythreonine transaminase [Gammaproteobacteria bacterium]